MFNNDELRALRTIELSSINSAVPLSLLLQSFRGKKYGAHSSTFPSYVASGSLIPIRAIAMMFQEAQSSFVPEAAVVCLLTEGPMVFEQSFLDSWTPSGLTFASFSP